MLQYLAQGACQALEDADCLAGQIAEHAGADASGRNAWDAALTDYAALRTDRTAQVQRVARTWGDLWHCDGLFRSVRNAYLSDRDLTDFRHVDWLYRT